MRRKASAILITIAVVVLLCVLGILFNKWKIERKRIGQLELEAALYEKAREMGRWDEMVDLTDIENINNEQTVCMKNLRLVIYGKEYYIYDDIQRRLLGFFLFSDGSVYTAVEYFQQKYHDPSESIYSITFNDEMWDHLSDWKYLGRISSEENSYILVNAWQAKEADYDYFFSNKDSGLVINGMGDYTSGNIYIDDNQRYEAFRREDGSEVRLPNFSGWGYIVIGDEEESTLYNFWGG